MVLFINRDLSNKKRWFSPKNAVSAGFAGLDHADRLVGIGPAIEA